MQENRSRRERHQRCPGFPFYFCSRNPRKMPSCPSVRASPCTIAANSAVAQTLPGVSQGRGPRWLDAVRCAQGFPRFPRGQEAEETDNPRAGKALADGICPSRGLQTAFCSSRSSVRLGTSATFPSYLAGQRGTCGVPPLRPVGCPLQSELCWAPTSLAVPPTAWSGSPRRPPAAGLGHLGPCWGPQRGAGGGWGAAPDRPDHPAVPFQGEGPLPTRGQPQQQPRSLRRGSAG